MTEKASGSKIWKKNADREGWWKTKTKEMQTKFSTKQVFPLFGEKFQLHLMLDQSPIKKTSQKNSKKLVIKLRKTKKLEIYIKYFRDPVSLSSVTW